MATRITKWLFADAAERDTYVGTSAGVVTGDECSLLSDESRHYYDGSAWRPFGGSLGQEVFIAGAGSPTVAVDWGISPNAIVDVSAVTGTLTFTFANPVAGATYTLLGHNGPGVGLLFAYPANVKWPLGVAAVLDPSGLVRLYYDGTDYWAVADVNLL